MAFYATIFDATLDMMRFGDSPMPCAPEQKQRVLHATLKAAGFTLMASDTQGQPIVSGDQVHLSLNFVDLGEQQRIWERLAEGATISMPLGEQFFGRFGMLTDKFGVRWMLHFNTAAAK